MSTLTKTKLFSLPTFGSEIANYVRLTDGSEIGVPIDWYLRLRDASEEDLNNCRFIALDEDLSRASFLRL